MNPNDENELFLPDGSTIGDLLLREKLPTPTGTSFPRPRQFHAHGYGKCSRSLGVFLRSLKMKAAAQTTRWMMRWSAR